MHHRILVLLCAMGVVLLWNNSPAIAYGQVPDKGAAPSAAAASPLSPHEERLYRLFESQLQTLTYVLTGVVSLLVILQVYFAYAEYRRQSSIQKQFSEMVEKITEQSESYISRTNNTLEATAALIGSMKNMTDFATQSQQQSQQLALGVEKKIKEAEEQKRQALEELRDNLRVLAEGVDTRFNESQQHRLADAAEGIMNLQLNYGARDAELPAEAHLVRGYYYSVVTGNYRRGTEEFGKVIADGKTPKLREIAYYNRGINLSNMRQYKEAIEDFEKASELNADNHFYRFYRLDTALLKAREEGISHTEPLVAEFKSLVEKIQSGAASQCEPLTRQQLLTRAALDYADLLIDNNDPKTAVGVLKQAHVKDNLFAMHLALVAQEKADPGVGLDSSVVTTCQERAKAEYNSKIEPRSRLLRGLILLKSYDWSTSDHVNDLSALRPQLLADVAMLEKQGGANLTVFSPVNRRNVSLHEIRAQIAKLAREKSGKPDRRAGQE